MWFARLVRTRGAAQALVDAGMVRLDGRRTQRAAALVRVGSIIGFADAAGVVRIVRVVRLPQRRGPPAEAAACLGDPAIDAPGNDT